MTKTLRRALPLVGAITLVGSAFMAGSGAALAGKPAPQIDGAYRGFCSGSIDDTLYRTSVDLSGKGRWAFVMVTLQLSGEPPQEFFADTPLKVRVAPGQEIQVTTPGGPKSATMTVTVTDRKGVPEPTAAVTTPPFCG